MLERGPFVPFRVFMSDGNTYEVTNPRMAIAMEHTMFVALPKSKWRLLAYENMTTIEGGEVIA